jgi:SRSO17 transposase
MTIAREAVGTVNFIDQYCEYYKELFTGDVRSYEYFKYLQLGMIAEIPRKSLPAIAKAVGLEDSQGLHHFVVNAVWEVSELREGRIKLIKKELKGRKITLCIDETGDRKKGNSTDYVARQYIGNLGKVDNGIVSVNAYGVLDGITFPLLFKIFKPQKQLKDGDKYKTKPALAVEIIEELRQAGFKFTVVLADSEYGESSDFIAGLERLKLKYVLAIRSNHGCWMRADQKIIYGRWSKFDRIFSNGETEVRYIREIIYGESRVVRYYQITTDKEQLPENSTWFVMTNLEGDIKNQVGNTYGLRTWIEYGFKQIKDELGWADYRFTDYTSIERWWEIVFSAYLMVSLQSHVFNTKPKQQSSKQRFSQHKWWDGGKGWKNHLNNLRLIIQPFVYLCLISPWLQVYHIPNLRMGFLTLVAIMNTFCGFTS